MKPVKTCENTPVKISLKMHSSSQRKRETQTPKQGFTGFMKKSSKKLNNSKLKEKTLKSRQRVSLLTISSLKDFYASTYTTPNSSPNKHCRNLSNSKKNYINNKISSNSYKCASLSPFTSKSKTKVNDKFFVLDKKYKEHHTANKINKPPIDSMSKFGKIEQFKILFSEISTSADEQTNSELKIALKDMQSYFMDSKIKAELEETLQRIKKQNDIPLRQDKDILISAKDFSNLDFWWSALTKENKPCTQFKQVRSKNFTSNVSKNAFSPNKQQTVSSFINYKNLKALDSKKQPTIFNKTNNSVIKKVAPNTNLSKNFRSNKDYVELNKENNFLKNKTNETGFELQEKKFPKGRNMSKIDTFETISKTPIHSKDRKLSGLTLNLKNIQTTDFNEEFLENVEDFSPSWRNACRKVNLLK